MRPDTTMPTKLLNAERQKQFQRLDRSLKEYSMLPDPVVVPAAGRPKSAAPTSGAAGEYVSKRIQKTLKEQVGAAADVEI